MTSPTFYKFLRSTLIAAALVFIPMYAFADYYVATTGSDSNTGTQSAPFKTILRASQAALPGNTIHVAPGTYAGGFKTTVSGSASARIRYVSDVKWGAKITPAGGTNSYFGNLWYDSGSYVTIDGFEVDGTADTAGFDEGIYTDGSFVIIQNNHVHHIGTTVACSGSGGAGIGTDNYNYGVNDDVIGNIVHNIGPVGCEAFFHGIYLSTTGNAKNNITYSIPGAGITTWHNVTAVNVINNTSFNNGYGIIIGAGDLYRPMADAGDYCNIQNNIVFDNTIQGISEQGITGIHNTYINNLVFQNVTNWQHHNGTTDSGTIALDPQFVNYVRTGGGNYHLKSTSPAIDRGTATYAPSTDYDGSPRPQGAGYDIGAYEYGGTVTTTSAPAVSLSPTSLNFGAVAVGSVSTQQVITITNTGSAALSFPVAFTMTGDFSFGGSGNCAVGTSYAPGASCTASVKFTPTVNGTRTGTLTITDNAGNSPQIVQLSGTGGTTVTPAPVVSLSPTSLSFGNVAVGVTSASQALTITNSGTANLSITTAFTFTGDFNGSGNCSTATALVPGASCVLNVTFTPTVSGTRTGTVTIATNAASSPNVVSLSGGVAITNTITTLTNGTVLTNLSGATGAQHMYQLTVPSGATNLRFVSSGGTGDLDLYAKFGSQPSTTVYDAKSDGATTAETIAIATPQAGTYYLLTNGWAAYSGVSLVGAYTAAVTSGPVVSLSPTSLNFGSVALGSVSTVQTVTITNSGTAGLIFPSSFTFTGDYTFGGTGTCGVGTSYAPGASCTASVKFTPTLSGARTGTLTITSNAASSPNVVQLTGTGGTTTITPPPPPPPPAITTLQNGVVLTNLSGATGAQHMYQLTVPSGATNLRFVSSGGTGDLDLYAKFGSQPSTTVYDAKSDGATTAETISIPTPQAGTYYLLTNGWAAYSGVSLVGAYTASVVAAPAVSLSSTSLNFGAVPLGSASTVQTVTITNTGTAGLSFPVGFTFTGDYNFGGTGTCVTGTSYVPGASCTASMKFTPTVSGTRTGTLTITDNAGNSPQVVQLTGTGGTVTTTPPPPPGGTTYTAAHHLYVATTGSDSNTGTQSAPFKTILKASQVAVADTIIHVAPGTYVGGFTTTKSGTASGRIRYLSDTKWGAKIIPTATSDTVWSNSGAYTDIIGFEITGLGVTNIARIGIHLGGGNSSVQNSHVHHIANTTACTNNGGAAIEANNGGNNPSAINYDFVGNLVHDIGLGASCNFIQGIYLSTSGSIKNNIVYNAGYDCIHLWHDANRVNVANNTVFNCTRGILAGTGDKYLLTTPGDYYNVYNNIIVDTNYAIQETSDGTGYGTHNSFVDNLILRANVTYAVHSENIVSGSILADPLFVNYIKAGGGDYHLQSGSPAINRGAAAYAPSTDFDGRARPQGAGFDIGAYER